MHQVRHGRVYFLRTVLWCTVNVVGYGHLPRLSSGPRLSGQGVPVLGAFHPLGEATDPRFLFPKAYVRRPIGAVKSTKSDPASPMGSVSILIL